MKDTSTHTLRRIALAIALLAPGACSRDDTPPASRWAEHAAAPFPETKDLPPVIVVADLIPLGFDSATLYQIEPHFALLNTALVALADLKRSYDVSSDETERNRLNAYAVPFHLTADNQQRVILRSLQPPLDSAFDKYVETRKRAVGLQDWHADHREMDNPRELPGLRPPRPPVR